MDQSGAEEVSDPAGLVTKLQVHSPSKIPIRGALCLRGFCDRLLFSFF